MNQKENIFIISDGLGKTDCNLLLDFLFDNFETTPKNAKSFMPWHVKNNVPFGSLSDQKIINLINSHKFKVSKFLSKKHGVEIHPHFSDLVLWTKGQCMPRHVDNGEEYLHMRKYTAVTYLNENFLGGDTFIKNGDKDFISKPITGQTVTFTSGEENAHGVTKIEHGFRATLAMWFCTDIRYKERP